GHGIRILTPGTSRGAHVTAARRVGGRPVGSSSTSATALRASAHARHDLGPSETEAAQGDAPSACTSSTSSSISKNSFHDGRGESHLDALVHELVGDAVVVVSTPMW